jgi:cytosolic carboxypeptidase protein 2/3
MIDFEPLYPP